jgi:NAD+ synthase (glutamine-hydrolysing)
MELIHIAVAQLNPVVGDLDYNSNLILDSAKEASSKGAKLLVTTELFLTGYPPEDLLFRRSFIANVESTIKILATKLKDFPDLTVLIGYPRLTEKGLQNCIGVFRGGEEIDYYAKQKLPNHEVFDEVRYFVPGNKVCVFDIDSHRIGVIICEDAWYKEPSKLASQAGAELLIVPNASPFHVGKNIIRQEVIAKRVSESEIPIVYVNPVGGQDELVFDGGSFAFNKLGKAVFSLPQFITTLGFLDFDGDLKTNQNLQKSILVEEDQVYKALVLGTKDYVNKNGFSKAIIGLSGGIDSALVLKIAVDALGRDNVRAVMMPSCFTAEISKIDAKILAQNLGVKYDEISITPMYDSFVKSLEFEFKHLPKDATEENIQARIRGTLLMALSNKHSSIVLTTGNKSELAVGYCTLYGDMAGGFAVIKDVPKSFVYRLCNYINRDQEIIPNRIITRPPSAELSEDQVDQDSLPEYEVLDAILGSYMENDNSPDEIISQRFDIADVEKVTSLIKINEYKRRQSPPGIRITKRAFGRDWRYPITNKFKG